MINWMMIGLGMGLALLVVAAAYAVRALDKSGAAAAFVLGTVMFGLGGLPGTALLLGFFISSSLLSRLFGKTKKSLNEKFSKGSRRDAAQVLANGGLAGVFILLGAFFTGAAWPWWMAAGALAAANADTRATELGVLSKTAPRLITTGKVVERGASGGVSLGGTLAALGGSAFIALIAVLVKPGGWEQSLAAFALVSLAGLAGSLLDSLLGATVQAIYTCPNCQKETERHPLHTCGAQTILAHGWPWMDNDWVNGLCTLGGALVALLAALV